MADATGWIIHALSPEKLKEKQKIALCEFTPYAASTWSTVHKHTVIGSPMVNCKDCLAKTRTLQEKRA
ncbi:MAG: hypothetical protein JWN89_473 [Parcubacteria group bacterium]|nr:hypothetical protein [Parcubacteria group bacterium]